MDKRTSTVKIDPGSERSFALVRTLKLIDRLFKNAESCISKSRSISANKYINSYIQSCDDQRLEKMGFNADEIRQIRGGKSLADIRGIV